MEDRTYAFPILHPRTQDGMLLRDWFAGVALAGMDHEDYAPRDLAIHAYLIADAMMEEREKKK